METIYATYRNELLAYAVPRVGGAAEDLVQAVFIELMEYPQAVLQPRGFLYCCLIHNISTYKTKRKRRQRLLLKYPTSTKEVPVDALDQIEQAGRIKRIIRTLRKREIVTSVLIEGLTCTEAATKHGTTVMAIRQAVKRARKIIRSHLRHSY